MIARLKYNRYTGKIMLYNMPLEDGQRLKVLIVNRLTNETEWIHTRLIKDVNEIWILEGCWGYDPVGLYAELLKPARGEPV